MTAAAPAKARKVTKQDRRDAAFLAHVIGPRKLGGRYRSGYWRQEYTVTAIMPNETYGVVITCEWDDGRITSHFTAWDHKRDSVVELEACA